jgi:hypothetical protein
MFHTKQPIYWYGKPYLRNAGLPHIQTAIHQQNFTPANTMHQTGAADMKDWNGQKGSRRDT